MEITRRGLLGMGIALPLFGTVSSCNSPGKKQLGKKAPKSKINAKSYWARREAWTGDDWVFGVVEIGDRILLVKRSDELGWSFPGGLVKPYDHGEKEEDNEDLTKAATVYAHDQGLIPVIASESIILSYGYAIDELHNSINMVHWVNVFCQSDSLPTPQANLIDILDARWVATDDPELGSILQQRLDEIKQAGEGKTFMLKNFR